MIHCSHIEAAESNELASVSSDAEDSHVDTSKYQKFIHDARSPEPVESSLKEAIDSAPLAEPRLLVTHLAHTCEYAKNEISGWLLTPIAGSDAN